MPMNPILRELVQEIFDQVAANQELRAALQAREAELAKLKAAVLPPIDPAFNKPMAGNGQTGSVPAGAIERTRE